MEPQHRWIKGGQVTDTVAPGKQFDELRLDGVGRSFGEANALTDLSLTIKQGEFIALLGPSGCGKSTALNCLAGLLPLTHGSIWQDDNRIDMIRPEKRGFGMVFQNYALFPHMSVRKNVAFGLEMSKIPSAQIKQRVAEAIELATAGRDRPCSCPASAAGADGRTVEQPGRQAASGDAHPDPPAAPGTQPDHGLRDP
jgi:putative spermidine/putrescine transport system ATP-binding protein